jgi:NitT/TauT family transport system permease protein
VTNEMPPTEVKSENKIVGWIQNYSFSIIALIVVFILWEVIVKVADVKTYILPAPSLIIGDIVDKFGLLVRYSLVTGWEILLGYLLSIIVGIPLGLAIFYSKFLERIIYPFLVISQTIPKIALAPLLILWLGWGIMPKIIVAFLIAFFPIVVDTVVGLKNTEPEMIHLVRSMGASRAQTFFKISLPNALPNIFGALKVASTLAVVGAVVGEFVASDSGLGYLLVVSQGYLDTTMMFAGIFFLSLLGIIFFFIIEILERIAIPWKVEKEGFLRNVTM